MTGLRGRSDETGRVSTVPALSIHDLGSGSQGSGLLQVTDEVCGPSDVTTAIAASRAASASRFGELSAEDPSRVLVKPFVEEGGVLEQP